MAFSGKKAFYADCTNLKEYEDYGYYCQSPLEYFLLPSDETPPLLVMRVDSRCVLCHKSPSERFPSVISLLVETVQAQVCTVLQKDSI